MKIFSNIKKPMAKFLLSLLFGLSLTAVVSPAFADTVLITGSNSGIGLEFARQYAARGWTVIATHRRDKTPDSLKALSGQYKNIRVERMDVTNHAQVDALANKLNGTAIDVLLNNAGVVFFGKVGDPNAGKAQLIGTLDYNQFDAFMHTNVMGPVKVAEAFLEHVKASKEKKIINISSAAGTITLPPRYPGMYWYKASKTALNMIMVSLANELKETGVTVAMFHPGFVRVERFEDWDAPGMIDKKESISGMIKVIDGLTVEDTGSFYKHTGEIQPW